MKNLLLLFTLTLFNFINAQEALSFSEVIHVDGASKEELYNRAKIWFSENFHKSKYVLDIDDKEEGILVGKDKFYQKTTAFMGSATFNGYTKYTLKMFFKEGRYKVVLTDFRHNKYFGLITTAKEHPKPNRLVGGGKRWYNKRWNELKENCLIKYQEIIISIKDKMETPAEVNNDDW